MRHTCHLCRDIPMGLQLPRHVVSSRHLYAKVYTPSPGVASRLYYFPTHALLPQRPCSDFHPYFPYTLYVQYCNN